MRAERKQISSSEQPPPSESGTPQVTIMIDQWTAAQILAHGKTDTPAKIAELEARTADRRRAFLASFQHN